MKFKPLFLSILFFTSLSAYSQNIDEIIIKGLSSISRGTVLSYLDLEVGDEVPNGSRIVQTSNALLKSDLFEKVQVDIVNSSLVIVVKENPIIKFIDFINFEEGQVLSEDIITDIKNNYNLKIGKIFIKKNLDKLLKQLKLLYSENAYYKAAITVNTNIDEQNRIGIELSFEEGEQALINKMDIKGNKFFDEEDILDLFNIGEADFFIFNYFTEKDQFNKREFEAGLEAIRNKYTNEGFLDLAFTKKNLFFNEERNTLDILIEISEGSQYKLGEIIFTGDLLNFDSVFLRKKILLDEGDSFKRSIVVDGVKKITKLYQDKGYAYASTTLQVKLVENTNLIQVVITIDPNERIYIDRIIIEGNFRTQDNVIRRQMSLNEGGVYSKSDLSESINKIKRLGYFSDVSYELKRKLNDNLSADLLISVTEQKTGEITIGLSHSNSTGSAINAGISQNNILGTGNTLDARISNSDAVEEMSFYFNNPYINNSGHSLSYGLTNRVVNASDLDASDYTLDDIGFSLGYGIPTSTSSSISAELKFSNIELKCGYSLKTYDEVSQCNSNDDLDIPLSITYTANTLNDFYFPTDGVKTSIKTSVGLPFSDMNYYLLETSLNGYKPILDDKIFKFSSRFKTGSGFAGDQLPFYKRFFEGGSSSVRGFDFNSLGAKYTTTQKPKGGEISWISSVAIGAPASFVGIDNQNIRVSTFIDGGLIGEKQSDLNFNELRMSSGIALNWLTPIGPIGIHYALPIVKKNGDSTTSFSFNLGTSF